MENLNVNNIDSTFENTTPPKERKKLSKKTKKLIFVWGMLAYPIIQFLIFFIYVNIDSILMSLERMMWSGTAAVVIRLKNASLDSDGNFIASENTRIDLNYIDGGSIIPLACDNGIIAEAAFCSELCVYGNSMIYLELHIKENGKYGRSLGLSYPNAQDAQRAFGEGRIDERTLVNVQTACAENRRPPWGSPLGGEIYIHEGGTASDWTAGCIALETSDMDRLFPCWTQVDEVIIEA